VSEGEKEPVAADDAAVNVSCAVPEPVTDAGVNVADTPEGRPDTPSAATPEKPFSPTTVTVTDADCPAVTAAEGAEIVSDGWGGACPTAGYTVSAKTAPAVVVPSLAVTPTVNVPVAAVGEAVSVS
jgi:hypothetical protein